jgi:hypothetical protein
VHLSDDGREGLKRSFGVELNELGEPGELGEL